MAWLTTYTDANKILDESPAYTEQITFIGSGIAVVSQRTVTEDRYRYVAMAKASAETAKTELLAATPSGTTRQVTIRRQGPSNGYDVCVSDIVYGEWAEV
jgi:hypothetical protein